MKNVQEISEGLSEQYKKSFEDAIKLVKESKRVRAIAHYDGDGVSSASILAMLLKNDNKMFHISFVKGIDEHFHELLPDDATPLLLLDIGSSALDMVKEVRHVILMDHHPMVGEVGNTIILNPIMYGLDGSREMCGTTISFLFSILYSEVGWKYIPFFLAGTIADRQHAGGYVGINKFIIEVAKSKGLVEVTDGLPYLDGKIADEIMESTDPYLPGVTGRREEVYSFLNKIKIYREKKYTELENEEKIRINSYIVYYLLQHSVRPEVVNDAISLRYLVDGPVKNSALLSAYMNTCGREGRESAGVLYALGNRAMIDELAELQKKFHEKVIRELIEIEKGRYTELNSLVYFKVVQPSIAGTIAGIAVNYITDQKKVVFGYSSSEDGKVKISSRGNRFMVNHGLDLNEVCREAAGAVGGKGGGHNIASGANIESSKVEEFMRIADDLISKQLHF